MSFTNENKCDKNIQREIVDFISDFEVYDEIEVAGHTPTMLIENNPRPGFIYQANNHIAIDCGCSFPRGRLGCLCLEDMKNSM